MVEKVEAEIYVEKEKQFKVHTSSDWPLMAEEMNWKHDSELVNTGFLEGIKVDYPNVAIDTNKSIEFFDNFEIPEKNKVVLKKKLGCMVCYNDFIDDKVHYALLKGYCDIKTVQYYLFEKGIMYRAWVLKEHMKHIDIQEISHKIKTNVSDFKIINDEIQDLRQEIAELKALGRVTDSVELSRKRQLMKELIEMKNKTINDVDSGDTFIKLEDVMKQLTKK